MQNILYFYLDEDTIYYPKRAHLVTPEPITFEEKRLEQVYYFAISGKRKPNFFRKVRPQKPEELAQCMRDILNEWGQPEYFIGANLQRRLQSKLVEPEHFLETGRLMDMIREFRCPLRKVLLVDPGEGDPVFLEFTEKQLRKMEEFTIQTAKEERRQLYDDYAEHFLEETGLIITFVNNGNRNCQLVIDYGKKDRAGAYRFEQNAIYIDGRSHPKRLYQIQDKIENGQKKQKQVRYLSILREASLTLTVKMGIIP